MSATKPWIPLRDSSPVPRTRGLPCSTWSISSVGQSVRFTSERSQVRALHRPLILNSYYVSNYMKTERQDNQSGLGQSATEPVVEVITLQDEYDDSAKERFANVRLDLEEKLKKINEGI